MRMMLSCVLLLASCGSVYSPPGAGAGVQTRAATAPEQTVLERRLDQWRGEIGATPQTGRAVLETREGVMTALIPTTDPSLMLFVPDLAKSGVQLLHVKDSRPESFRLTTTYLETGVVVETVTNTLTGAVASAEVRTGELGALCTVPNSLRQSLVAANFGLAAVIAYCGALASCAGGPWCLAAVAGAQVALAAAGASVNAAQSAIEEWRAANC